MLILLKKKNNLIFFRKFMKVLVTGADGFIGSHLVEKLIKNNYQVKAFCIYNSNGSKGWLETLPEKSLRKLSFF